MTLSRSVLLRAACALAALSPAALAATSTPTPLTLTAATLVVTEQTQGGKRVEVLTDASRTQVVPGSLLELRQTFRNVSAGTLRAVTLSMKVDPATTFVRASCTVGGAAASVGTQFSADGGRTYAPAPLMKTVTVTENGRSVQKKVEVRPSEYTGVRWTLPALAAAQEGRCALRAVVR